MTNLPGRLDRIEDRRHGGEAGQLVADLAARHGIDAGSIRAKVARILDRAEAVGRWSPAEEVAPIAAESGHPVAEVQARYEGILAGMDR